MIFLVINLFCRKTIGKSGVVHLVKIETRKRTHHEEDAKRGIGTPKKRKKKRKVEIEIDQRIKIGRKSKNKKDRKTLTNSLMMKLR